MFSVTTICHKTSDCRHPLLMLTNREGNRYFFGKVPEGAQRTLNENGFRMGRLRSIFMTGVVSSWSEIGGLPGLFLTISDATARGIDVFTNSAKILTYVVATWRYFVFRKGIDLNVLDAAEQPLIGDSSAHFIPIKVAPNKKVDDNRRIEEAKNEFDAEASGSIFRGLKKLTSLMFPKDTSRVNSADPESYKSDPSETEIHTHVKLPDPSLLADIRGQSSLSYLIRFLPVRGKFDPVKAKALGIKPGLNYRKLTDGESVTSESGDLVHPHQVMEAPKQFQKVLILDIPSAEYLQNSIDSNEWFEKSELKGPEDIGLVYHFLGDDVDFSSPEYVQFLEKFPPQCQHVISHSQIADDTLVFKTSTIHLFKLKSVMTSNFSLPSFGKHSALSTHHKLQSLQQFTIDATGVSVNEDAINDDSWESLYDGEVANPEARAAVFENPVISLAPVDGATTLKDHVQIVTLGTGSALPSIHRNVLSNLLRIPYLENNEVKFNGILLDGGENTLGSMVRNYGHNNREQLTQILEELSLIYLSHLHADHHLGIVSVVVAWFDHHKHSDKKLYLVIPWQYNNFLEEWFGLEKNTSHVDLNRIVYISCEDFMKNPEPEFQQMQLSNFEEKFDNGRLRDTVPRVGSKLPTEILQHQLYQDLNISSINTVRAVHCYWAYCVSITFQLGESQSFKVSFSGDTRPNPKFVDIGHESDLLIHEASLENELIEEAIAKKHTTVAEAVRMCQLMNCPKLLLTHFSTRFSEKQSFIESAEQYEQMADHLKSYLGNSISNIFAASRPDERSFDDIELCYAYDMMTVRYNDFGFQKQHYDTINALSASEDTEAQKLRDEKEQQKKSEKREAKRLQRLSMGRKRKFANEAG